jgi:topoisomerase-4 subunit A
VRAFFVKESYMLTAVADSGATYTFSTEAAPIEDRKSPGKPVVPLKKSETLVDVVKPT